MPDDSIRSIFEDRSVLEKWTMHQGLKRRHVSPFFPLDLRLQAGLERKGGYHDEGIRSTWESSEKAHELFVVGTT